MKPRDGISMVRRPEGRVMANAVPNTTLMIRQATTEMIRLVMWYLGFFSCALLANRVLNRICQMMDQKVKPSLSSRKK